MTLFKQRKPVNSEVQLSKYKGNSYLNLGMRRVYSTGSWSEKWRRWSQDHGSIDSNGAYLTCSRPYYNGRRGSRGRIYTDMSLAHMDIQHVDMPCYDPVNTKYMTKHYVNGKSLKELAHMSTGDFERFMVNLPGRRTNQTKTGKRR